MTTPAGQIIIVKRNYDQEDGHHGGAWKIAFADFMTAMMAFFLVMWLTNASDDATKKKIAHYFNPIQLNSMSPAHAGLEDKSAPDAGAGEQKGRGLANSGENRDDKPVSGTTMGGEEQALFRDPYAVLAEIAADGGSCDKQRDGGVPNGTGLPGLNGGEAYRDPFDPTSWQLAPNAVAKAPADTPMTPSELALPTAAGTAFPRTEVTTAGAEAKPAAPASPPPVDAAATKAEGLAKEIAAAAEAVSPGASSGIEVSAGAGGVTISLADQIAGGMFQIGSAKPTPEALALVEKIGTILAERPGAISIRGHTDARPYRGAEYDNWRLSAARAQFVFYMLVRGGLDEKRVSGIEGVADRDPKLPGQPDAAENRRIEIFLKEPAA